MNKPSKADELVSLAQAEFSGLSEAELRLLRAAANGGQAVCGPSNNFNDASNDPAKSDGWGVEREIRAELLRWLCLDREASSRVDPAGLQVLGAKITGALNLSFGSVPFPLGLFRCRLLEPAQLRSTQIPALYLNGSRTKSIFADGVNVKGSVFLRQGFTAEGEVQLLGAQIGGNLECSGGAFKNARGKALNADGAEVKVSVFLRQDFTAEGEVRLLGAQIGGNLECSGGAFKNAGGKALDADGAKVKGSVFLRQGFTAEGEVLLLRAQIGGNLQCDGGAFSALSAETAVIKGGLLWRQIANPQNAKLNLINASVGAIVDDEASWPKAGNLALDGFVYQRFSGRKTPKDAKKRLEWLDRLDEFSTQPYRQLAKVLRETGDERGADRVLYEMERRAWQREAELAIQEGQRDGRVAARARFLSWWLRAKACILRITIGYGVYPLRVWEALAFLVALGFSLFHLGYFRGAMTPVASSAAGQTAYLFFKSHGRRPDGYPAFNSLAYSVENTIQVLRLGQSRYWAPDPSPPTGRPFPAFLRWFRWFQIVAGWVLVALFLAGVTGIARRRE